MSNVATLPVQEAPAEAQRVSANELMMNPESMDRVMRMAEMMASGKSTIPAHLQKNPADCMAVVLQAMQWGMLPHIVAQKTHLVNGTLGYEAQLVNAVVQASGCITGRFHYEYKGNSPTMECRVGAVIRGEREITWGEWLNESKVTTKNSPLWKVNPRQQMGYLQVKNWARAFAPGAILGIYTPDEVELIPRNMGTVEVMEVPQGLIEQAETAAAGGVASYQKFWSETGAENRKLLASQHAGLKQTAIDADKSRTVDTKETPVKTDAPEVTLQLVLDKLNAAKNEDALNVAGDWINALSDSAEIQQCSDLYDQRLAEMRGL